MKEYGQHEHLILKERVWITKEVKKLLRKMKQIYKERGEKWSQAKLVSNLIIREYEDLQRRLHDRTEPE